MRSRTVGGLLLAMALALLLIGTVGLPAEANPGYTFVAPAAISLGSMTPRPAPYTSNSMGTLMGDNPGGYTVTAVAANTTNTGYMISGGNVLHDKLKIGKDAGNLADSNTVSMLLDTSSNVTDNVTVPLYVSQLILGTDNVSNGYSITIVYTVTAKQ